MLETLVPSRIRRTLLEHILAHPDQQFYLRGIAKELNLSVSPVRRELKRMEDLGLLSAHHEANLLLYVVNQSSPLFIQLRQAAQSAPAANEAPGVSVSPAAVTHGIDLPLMMTSSAPAAVPVAESVASAPVAAPQAVSSAQRGVAPVAAPARRMPLLAVVGGVALSLALLAGAAGMVYLVVMNYRLVTMAQSALPGQRVASRADEDSDAVPASGEMRSHRWRLMPGTVGGFSSGTEAPR